MEELKIGDFVCPHCFSKGPHEGYVTMDMGNFVDSWHEVLFVKFKEVDLLNGLFPEPNFESFYVDPLPQVIEPMDWSVHWIWWRKWSWDIRRWDKFNCPDCGIDFQEPLHIESAHQLMTVLRH